MINHDKPSFRWILGFSVLVGTFIGVTCIWVFLPFETFLGSVGAGVAFAVTMGIISIFAKLSKKYHFRIAAIVAGCVGGGTWWVIEKPKVSIFVSVGIGVCIAFIAFKGYSDFIFRRKNSSS